MPTIFCPNCETYLPPQRATCPHCGHPRPAASPIPVTWTLNLDAVPAGPPLQLGNVLLLPGHDPGQPPRQATLHRLGLDGRQQGQAQVFEGALISGISLGRLPRPGQGEQKPDGEAALTLIATYSSDPTASTGGLLALTPTGQERWRWTPGVQAVSAPALAGGKVWVTTNTGLLVGLDLENGTEQARIEIVSTPSRAAPLVHGDVAYLPSRGPHLLAVRLDSRLRWRFEAPSGWLDQTPLLAGDKLWAVINLAGFVVALDPATGQALHQIELGPQHGKRLSPPAADGERLYAGAGNGLYAFSLEAGRQLWHFPTGRRIEAAPVIASGLVYAAGRDHVLYALDATTGQEVWRYEAETRLEVPPLLTSGDLPLVIIANRTGQVTALHRPLAPAEHEAAGHWLAAAEEYAAQGDLLRAAELLQLHNEPFKAAQLWQALGNLNQAAQQYERAGRWVQASELWRQLDQPLRQAEALVRQARSLAEDKAETVAELWSTAAALFQDEGEWEQAALCRREEARHRHWPLLEVEVQADEGLVHETYSRLKFTIRNQGYGRAHKLMIQVVNKALFAGQLAETRQIASLRPGQIRQEWLNVKPLEVGQVPLQLKLSYQDSQGQNYSQNYPIIYLPVARFEAERQPGKIYQIYTGGGAYIEGDVNTAGGDFTGRDQTHATS